MISSYPMRRGVRRTGFRRRRRNRWQWVREVRNLAAISPGQTTTEDLLASFRTVSSWTIQFPEIVIWRVHLRISARIRLVSDAFISTAGMNVALYVDSLQQSLADVVLQSYSAKFMMFDSLYVSEQVYQGFGGAQAVATSDLALYRNYDIKSHRRLPNVNDTLLLGLTPLSGTASIPDTSLTMSILLKLP